MTPAPRSPPPPPFFLLASLLAVAAIVDPGRAAGAGARRAAEPGARALKLGAVGYIKSETRFSVTPLVEYLGRSLGRPVRLVLYPGYNDVMVAIAGGDLEMAILPPVVHLHVHDTLGVRTLAYGVYPNSRFTYHSVLLARKGDPAVRSMADLKGRKVGFVDLFSASGYVYPKLMLSDAGVGAKSVTDVFFGNHLDALRALDHGEVAAAATYDLVFEEARMPGRTLSSYAVLATSEPIPSEAVVATTRMDGALADRIQDLLLQFYSRRREPGPAPEAPASPSGSPAGDRKGLYIGFIPPDESLLTALRSTFHRVVPEAAQGRQ
jgi:phosphonate transport system substrate-binding protein